jgi:hypothetical protein
LFIDKSPDLLVEAIKIVDEFEFRHAVILQRSDGVMNTMMRPEVDFGIEDVDEICAFLKKKFPGQRFPFLISGGKFIRIENGLREHYAKVCAECSLADAFVTNNLPERMIANFYIQFNKPAIPTRLFRDEFSALRWLQETCPDSFR